MFPFRSKRFYSVLARMRGGPSHTLRRKAHRHSRSAGQSGNTSLLTQKLHLWWALRGKPRRTSTKPAERASVTASLTCNSEKLETTDMSQNRGFWGQCILASPHNEMLHSCWNDAQMDRLSRAVFMTAVKWEKQVTKQEMRCNLIFIFKNSHIW